MRRVRAAAALTLVLLAGSAYPAFANDAAIGGVGGAIQPITVADIRMEAETVQFVVYGDYAAVRVDFKFVNGGPARTVKLGFPFALPYEQQDLNDLPPAAGFRAWQDGAPLSVEWVPPKRRDGIPVDSNVGYFVHEATFKPGTTMIRVEYLAEPFTGAPSMEIPKPPAKYAGMYSGYGAYDYWVHTGSGWAGNIGKTVIRYRLTEDFTGWGVETAQKAAASQEWVTSETASVLLDYEKPDANTYQWTFLDYDPVAPVGGYLSKYDTSLNYYRPMWWSADPDTGDSDFTYNPAWPPEHIVKAEASSFLKLGDYEYPAEAAFLGVAWAWAEGVSGSGSGQWVKATFAGERAIREIRILPGYAKSPALFAKYNRPKTLSVEFSDGTKQTLRLADEPSLQRFPVNVKAKWAKVTIGEVYRGTTRDETYVSLVDFGKAPGPEFASFEQLVEGKAAAAEVTATQGGAAGGTTPAAGGGAGGRTDPLLIVGVAIAVGALCLALVVAAVWFFVRLSKGKEKT